MDAMRTISGELFPPTQLKVIQMSDSKSRYGIVFDLAQQKLAIMDDKQRIEGDIEAKKLSIEQKKNYLKSLETQYQKELIEAQRYTKAEIAKLEQEIASEIAGKNTRSALCDEKIAEIDKAMEAIQEISKSSAEEAKY